METMEKEHTEHALAAHLVCVNHRGSKVLLVLLQSVRVRVITALTLPISNFATSIASILVLYYLSCVCVCVCVCVPSRATAESEGTARTSWR